MKQGMYSTQEKYIKEILKTFGKEDSVVMCTTMATWYKLFVGLKNRLISNILWEITKLNKYTLIPSSLPWKMNKTKKAT